VKPQHRERKKPKRSKVRLWCPGGDKPVGGCEKPEAGKTYLKPKMVRCGICDQRFETKNNPAEPDNSDIHRRVPPHKAY
jgi:hypothetical protein